MSNLILTNTVSSEELKIYFQKVLELTNSGEEFPVNLEEVWPLVYSEKGKAVRALKNDFIQGVDYTIAQNGNPDNQSFNPNPRIDYLISSSCLEYLIVRKVRPVFEVYREVFHRAINQLPTTFAEALQLAADQAKQIEIQEKELRIKQLALIEAKPKVDFAERFITSDDLVPVSTLAKVLNQNGFIIGQNRLFKLLEELGMIFRNGSRKWEPYQEYSPKSIELKETTFNKPSGKTGLSQQILITAHGQALIIKKIFKTHREVALKFGSFRKDAEKPF